MVDIALETVYINSKVTYRRHIMEQRSWFDAICRGILIGSIAVVVITAFKG